MSHKPKLIRITTIPLSLDKLLEGQLRYISQFYDVIAMSSSDQGYLEKVALRENVRFHPIELTRRITPVKDFISLLKLIKFLKKEKPHIVHTHTPKAGITGMLAAKIAGVPIRLHTVAGLPLLEKKGFKRQLLNFVEKLTYASATKVLPNSRGLGEIIVNHKFTNPKKIHVIAKGSSNGIDTTYFDPQVICPETKDKIKNDLGIKPTDFVYIFVGRLVKDKGIKELIDAFSKITDNNAKLILIGPKEPKLDPLSSDTLQEIKTNPNIIDLGWLQDIRPYLAISHALTFPSYREGFPNVVMQANAMELPAIVSNINGCNEIISHKINGLIVPPKDTEALYQAMLKIKDDTALYQTLKQHTRANILAHYKREIIMHELKAYYDAQLKTISSL